VASLFGTTAYVGTLLFLMPFYFFFFAWRFPEIVAWPTPLIPASRRQRTRDIVLKMDQVVASFFRVRFLIALVMGVLFSLGWMLAGVPYWFLLGMLGGLLSIIPYAAALAWLSAILLKYLELSAGFDLMAVIVWPTVVYGIVQAIEGWVLTPVLQGQEMDMGTVEVIIVLFVGGALAGLLGMLLCIPAWACIKVLLREVAGPHIRQWAESH
jgi:predicted PurR-regulated permease PerM